MLYRIGFDLKTCLRMSPLKWDMSQPSEMFIAREIKHKSRWYQISRLFIISNSWNLIRHIVLLISRLPEIIQKRICTPDRAMDPSFQINQPSSMFLAGETVSSGWFSKVRFFFSTPFICFSVFVVTSILWCPYPTQWVQLLMSLFRHKFCNWNISTFPK